MTLQPPEQVEQLVRSIRDHFIPVSRQDLNRSLLDQWLTEGAIASKKERFERASEFLSQAFEEHFLKQLKGLIDDYQLFDPDSILVDLKGESEQSHEQRRVHFFESLQYLLERANFRRLEREEIQQAMKAAKALGVRLVVDFDAFAHLSVWVRGEHCDRWTVRRWYRFFRAEQIEVPVHRRLVLVFQDASPQARPDADPNAIFLKIFKNIPCSDVDTLLPASRIQLSWIDRGKIIFPTISGIGLSLAKVAKVGALAMFGGIYGLIALGTLIATGVGYSLRSFFGYLHTKDKYQLNLTRHLYYQNLGNNVGVLFRLIHEAENQEYREALLAYWALLTRGVDGVLSRQELDRAVEEWILRHLGVAVDFEDDDALRKLKEFGLAEPVGPDHWRLIEEERIESISEAWA